MSVKFTAGVVIGVVVAAGLVGFGEHLGSAPNSSVSGGTSSVPLHDAAYSSYLDAHVNDDDYPQPYRGYAFDRNTSSSAPDKWGGFDSRNCTSFVAWRATSRDNFDMAGWVAKHGAPGNANNWLNAFDGSVRHDGVPAVGAAGVQTSGHWGHVAWVQEVQGSNLIVEDYNASLTGQYGSWTVPASDFAGFVHFEDFIPKPSASAPQPPVTVGGTSNGQGGSGTIQGSTGTQLQGQTGTTLQGSSAPLQGGPAAPLQGPANSGAGGGGATATQQQAAQQQAAAAAQQEQQAAAAAQQQAAAAIAAQQQAAAEAQRVWNLQHPVYPVMNTSETAPDGVWWRNSSQQDATSGTNGYGVYAGDQVRLTCYAMGGPAVNGNHVWYRATDLSRTWQGGESAGWISAHYVNDGSGMDQVAQNVQPC